MSKADQIYVSTSCLAGDRHLATVLDCMANLGIRNVELSGPHPYIPDTILESMLFEYRNTGMRFIIHNYFPPPDIDFVLNIASFDQTVIKRTCDLVLKAISLAERLETPFYGCHAGYLADAAPHQNGTFAFYTDKIYPMDRCMDQVKQNLHKILTGAGCFANSRPILLENLFPTNSQTTYSLACTADEINALFKRLEDSRIGLLLDLAHFELTCSLYRRNPDKDLDALIEGMGPRIRSVHLSGIDGQTDCHTPLISGAWQLKAAGYINRLFRKQNRLTFTLECRGIDEETLLSQIELLAANLD